MDDLRHWYIVTYADRNFSAPTAWFSAYMWLEALYHVPLSFWAVGALARDDPLVPVHLLVFALETALTTLTCVAEYLSWADFTPEQKWNLGGLYVPYLALCESCFFVFVSELLGVCAMLMTNVRQPCSWASICLRALLRGCTGWRSWRRSGSVRERRH